MVDAGRVTDNPDDEMTAEEKAKIESDAREQTNNSRLSALDAIADSVDRERGEDFNDLELDEPSDEEDDTRAADVKPEETSELDLEDEDDDLIKPEDIPPGMDGTLDKEPVTIVVDGQEVTVTKDAIYDAGVRTLQKDVTADKRLQKASQVLEAAYAAAEKIPTIAAQPADRLPSTEEPEGAGDEKVPGKDVREEIVGLVHGIQYGSEEDGVSAIERVIELAKGQPTQPGGGGLSQADVATMVEDGIALRDIRVLFEDKDQDEGGFSDISGDPNLKQMAVNVVERLIEEGADSKDWTIYERAGNAVRNWRDKVATGNKKTPTLSKVTNLADKLERKRGRGSTLPIADARHSEDTTESPEESLDQNRAEAIDEIKKSRGQG